MVAGGRHVKASSFYEQQAGEIKLVVSDLMMPQLDGTGMIRGLRQH